MGCIAVVSLDVERQSVSCEDKAAVIERPATPLPCVLITSWCVVMMCLGWCDQVEWEKR